MDSEKDLKEELKIEDNKKEEKVTNEVNKTVKKQGNKKAIKTLTDQLVKAVKFGDQDRASKLKKSILNLKGSK